MSDQSRATQLTPALMRQALTKPGILDPHLETLVHSKAYDMSYMQAARELYFLTMARLEVLQEEESHEFDLSTILRLKFEEEGSTPDEPRPSKYPPRMRKFEKVREGRVYMS
ncbi:hypothetical protein C0993_006524 [Termitomyces sp. T159_Od127]|nr:hypothetical protein C0993_006524 [Termitomyces sp. T159_Od127]